MSWLVDEFMIFWVDGYVGWGMRGWWVCGVGVRGTRQRCDKDWIYTPCGCGGARLCLKKWPDGSHLKHSLQVEKSVNGTPFQFILFCLSASFLLYSLDVACYAFKDKTDNMLNNQTKSAQATADLGLRLDAFNEKKPRKCIAFGALLFVCPWGISVLSSWARMFVGVTKRRKSSRTRSCKHRIVQRLGCRWLRPHVCCSRFWRLATGFRSCWCTSP